MPKNRWAPFSDEELDRIRCGLFDERYDPVKGWEERNWEMLEEIREELNRRKKVKYEPLG